MGKEDGEMRNKSNRDGKDIGTGKGKRSDGIWGYRGGRWMGGKWS